MRKISRRSLRVAAETIRHLSSDALREPRGGREIQQTGMTVCAACSQSDTVPSHCNTCYTCPVDTDQAGGCTISTSG